MPNQTKLDKAYMDIAYIWSLQSHCERNKVGCIIVKDNMIISDGYNGTPAGYDNNCEYETRFGYETRPEVLHAESNALMKLAKSANSSKDSTIYLSISPCFDCAKLIIQAGVKRVVYIETYRIEKGIEFLRSNNIIAERVTVPEVTTISAIHDSCGYDV